MERFALYTGASHCEERKGIQSPCTALTARANRCLLITDKEGGDDLRVFKGEILIHIFIHAFAQKINNYCFMEGRIYEGERGRSREATDKELWQAI